MENIRHTLSNEEIMHIYNIIGIFVSNKRFNAVLRDQIVLSILNDLYQKLISCGPAEKDKLLIVLKFINTFTKGFL